MSQNFTNLGMKVYRLNFAWIFPLLVSHLTTNSWNLCGFSSSILPMLVMAASEACQWAMNESVYSSEACHAAMNMDQNNGTVYSRDFLVGIGNFVLHHKQLRILPFDTIKTVRSYNLHRKTRRCKRGGYQQRRNSYLRLLAQNRSVNHHNLTVIECQPEEKVHMLTQELKICTINAQSIRHKDCLIRNILDDERIDIAVITETWLRSEDDVFCECTIMNNEGYSFINQNRRGNRRGGGLGLVLRKPLKCCARRNGSTDTCEIAEWKIVVRNKRLAVLECTGHQPLLGSPTL